MKNKLFLLVIISLFIINGSQAQNKKRAKKTELSGLVIDTKNKPIENASIFINGKNCKTLSDEEGRFKLKIKSDVKTITVFTIAQGATEVAYTGEAEMTFILAATEEPVESTKKVSDNDSDNSEYIKSHKRNLTSYTNKNNRNTINADHYLTIYEMIQGEIGGVTVSGSTIRIRGVGSLTGSTTPLFIVNGMPVSSLDHVSPSEVKSISVLKDSSAAIYGIRGANGVIVITLKTTVYD